MLYLTLHILSLHIASGWFSVVAYSPNNRTTVPVPTATSAHVVTVPERRQSPFGHYRLIHHTCSPHPSQPHRICHLSSNVINGRRRAVCCSGNETRSQRIRPRRQSYLQYIHHYRPLLPMHHLDVKEMREAESARRKQQQQQQWQRQRLSGKRTRLKDVRITARYNAHTQSDAVAASDRSLLALNRRDWRTYIVH